MTAEGGRQWAALLLLLWWLSRSGSSRPSMESVSTVTDVGNGKYYGTESGETWFETGASHELGPGVWFRVGPSGELTGPV